MRKVPGVSKNSPNRVKHLRPFAKRLVNKAARRHAKVACKEVA